MPHSYMQSLSKSNKALFNCILEFNLDVACYIDPSHLKDICPLEFYRKLIETTRGKKRLSHFLLEWFKLEMVFDLENNALRFALLSPSLLQRLVLYAGAALYSGVISKTIDKNRMHVLKNFLGENIYIFAVKRAPFFNRLVPTLACEEYRDDAFLEAIAQGGRFCLELCLANAPVGVTERTRLKFPVDKRWNFHRPVEEEERTKAFSLLRRILVKEMNSEESVCFN